jgi:hypothetical protein
VRIERSGADLWPHAADFTADFPLGENLRSPTLARAWDPPMRRTALAPFVIKPTHLRCGKLDLIQAKSKFRMEASVGGFADGIAASCIARKFELPELS